MTELTLNKKIEVLEHALTASAGAYYNINLTRGIVPGTIYQVIDGVEYNVNTLIGVSEDAQYKTVMDFWARLMPENERSRFLDFTDAEHLLKRYAQGQRHVFLKFWTSNVLMQPMLAEQHICMFVDDETGDIMAINYLIDLTERDREEVYTRHLEKSRENLENRLEVSSEKLDIERQCRNVLYQQYALVYYVDLKKDTAEVLKLSSFAHVARMDAVKANEVMAYTQHIREFSEKYVADNPRAFQDALSIHNIVRQLSNVPRFVIRFDSLPNDRGNCHYEVHVMRVNPDRYDGRAIITSEEIDDVIYAEYQRQRELMERLERERNQLEVLSVLAQNFDAIFKIDLEDDQFESIFCRDEIAHFYNFEAETASQMLNEVCEKIVDGRYVSQMKHFFDLKTMARRLENQGYEEIECITREGNWHRARIITKRRNDDGKIVDVMYVTQVIDAEKAFEENLIAKAEHADSANRAKTEFISQIAHDIRTPMNSVLGFLEIAKANLDNREKLNYAIERIETSGHFLQSLVNDVLDIYRMENDKLKFQPTEMRLSELLRELPIAVSSASYSKKQIFKTNIHDITYDVIVADPLRIKQIFSNVLTNAIKYTHEYGRVEFEVYEEIIPDSPNVRLVGIVTDNGIGMSEAFMQKMFSKFERATDTRINKVSGYGLGLSIVRQLVNLMNGTIDVKSTLGLGTQFTIVLEVPYGEDKKHYEIEKQVKVDYGALCQNMHVLVAEDNALNREVITELLSMYGVSCECTVDGLHCLQRFNEAPAGSFDAILMDMQMPNMNGLTATRCIRAINTREASDIPIIAMTANALKEDIQKCMEAGMNRHMAKPIDVEALLKVLAEVTGRIE